MSSSAWTLLSNHGHVLVCLALDPSMRMRDVAQRVGITERAVQLIIRDLIDAGFLATTKVGRRNRYTLSNAAYFRHPLEEHVRVGDFLDLVGAVRQNSEHRECAKQVLRP